MFNYYLSNTSYLAVATRSIEENLRDLNDLVVDERNDDDSFLYHSSIWYIETAEGSFADVVFSKLEDEHLRNSVLPRMFQSIESVEKEILSFDQFDKAYCIYNAFYGVHFVDINLERCVTNKETYAAFRQKFLWEVTPNSFWARRESLFLRVILCNNIEDNIKTVGGKYLQQILNKLHELDKYINNHWTTGNFNYKDANLKTSLNISPESKITMEQDKYRNQRIFSMPDGRRECFELHIKTGEFRFHFFPENGNVYIGYIGKHLDTDRFN